MQLFNQLPEDVLAEVIGEALYVQDVPTTLHQRIAFKLLIALNDYVSPKNLGEIFHCPTGVFLEGGLTVLIPDIIFISRDNHIIIDRKGIYGPPDLVIEVLSPSTRRRDLSIKKLQYEKAGVKEYWVIDPDTKDALGYLLEDNLYGDTLQLNSEIHVRILDKTFKF